MKRHIGNIIKKEYERSGMKLNVFAERIGMTYRNVYRVFEREDINTELLERIGDVLNYDFFVHYYKNDLNTVQEQTKQYTKQKKRKPLKISLSLEFDDEEKKTQLIKLMFGDSVPESLKGYL